MARRYFNWKLIIVSLLVIVVLGGSAFVLRQWQRSRRAEQGLVRGNKAYDEHKWEEAAQQLGRYLGVAQDDIPALLKYAEAQLNIRPVKQSNVQQAIAVYRNILRLDQGNLEAVRRLSEIYLSMGMPGEAELIASRFLQINESSEIRRTLAISLASQRKFTEAANELKSAIKNNPNEVSSYDVLGRLTEQRPGDFSGTADFWFDQAIQKNPSSAAAYIARGAYYLRQAKKDEALADFGRAEQMDLSDSTVRLRLAEALISAGVFDRAEKQLEIFRSLEPGNQRLWRLWAKLAIRADSNDVMSRVAEDGLKELASQPWDFMPDAVELFIRCGRLGRAGECLDLLKQKDIAPATTAFLDGLLAEKQGDDRKAVECWQRAIKLGAKFPNVRIFLANSLLRLGDKQAAINQLRTLVSEQPGLFNAHIALAQMLLQTGKWNEAADQISDAKQIFPKSTAADLLDVRVKMQLLADSGTDANSVLYRDIKATLDGLDKATDTDLEVKLMQIRLAYLQNNLSEAEKLIADLEKTHPDELRVVLAQADLLVAQNKTDKAIALLREANDKFPRSTAVLKYLVTLMSAKNQLQDCTALLEQALTSVGQPLAKRELGLLLSRVYGRTNENDKRYLLLKSLADELQNDIPVLRELLTCREVSEDAGFSQQIIDRIKKIEGDDGWQWRYEQAKLWFERGDFKTRYPEIVALLQKNLLTNPDDQPSRMLLAAAYEKGNNQQLAISTYDEALGRSPSDVRIMVPAIAAFYRGGKYDRADEILRRAEKEQIYHPDLERLEIQGALRRGDLGSANDSIEEMLLRDPNNHSLILSLALLKIRQDKIAEAEGLVKDLRAQEPNSLPIAAVQIELDIRKGNSDGALSICDEIVNKLNTASAFLLRARTYALLKQPDKAKVNFERAVTMEPNNPDAWIAKIGFHRSLGESDKAIADIRRALSIMPKDLRIQKTAIALYLGSDQSSLQQEAETILEEALVSNPDDSELLFRKAQILLVKGTAPQIKQAVGILQSITERQPKFTEAWVLLAQVALKNNEPAKAIDIALNGLVHTPNDRALLLLKARAEAARSPELSLPTMRALWELDPNNTDTTVSLAETYMAAGKYGDAVNLLKKQSLPADIAQQRRIKLALAAAIYKNGDKAESEQILKELSESEPNDPSPLLTQVRLFHSEKLWSRLREKTVTWCQEHPDRIETILIIVNELAGSEEGRQIAEELLGCVLEHDENSTVAMVRLGILLQTSGRSEEAVITYQRVLELQPDNLVALNNLAWILCEVQNHPQEALELAQQGLARSPDYVDLIDTRGMAYYRLGRYEEAVKDFNRCINLYPIRAPGLAASYFHLGRCLAELGDKSQAVVHLNRAMELNKKLGALNSVDIEEVKKLLVKLSSGED